MKILCLVDWRARGRWFWDYLPGSTDTVDWVTIDHPADRFPGYGKLLGYYERYGWLALKALPRLNRYDVVLAWEGKNGVPVAFLRSLLRRTAPPLVILNFVLKGPVTFHALPLLRFALRSADLITCVSQLEAAYYPGQLRLPAERFAVLPTFAPDIARDCELDSIRSDYIFAAGRSHRDYATLAQAVRDLPVHVVINARDFNVRGIPFPENVTLNPILPYDRFLSLLHGAQFIVIPLYEAKHASGETFLLQAMAARKAVIATDTYSTREYVRPGLNGLLVPPGDPAALRDAIQSLLQAPDRARAMGLAARRCFETEWSYPAIAPRVQALVNKVVGGQRAS